MKILKTVSIVVFIVSVILFGGYLAKENSQDQAGPEISLDSDHIQVSVKDDKEALLAGVTASDAGDGDLTGAVCVESVGPFDEEGNRVVRYVVFDSDGHVARAFRKMSYTDYTAPVIEISGPLTFSTDSTNLVEGITVVDCLDGDITGSVQIIFADDTKTTRPGIYPARLKARNSAGGTAELPVTYEIYDPAEYNRLPRLTLNNYLLRLKKGDSFNAADQLSSVVIGGTEYQFVRENGTYGASGETADMSKHTIDQSLVTITGEVDTNTAGCYEVDYSLKDDVFSTGTGTARLYVVISEGGAE